jgi:hypothetical protein
MPFDYTTKNLRGFYEEVNNSCPWDILFWGVVNVSKPFLQLGNQSGSLEKS